MTPEAFDELVRRANAGEDISGPFDLKTGRPAPMQSSMREILDEQMKRPRLKP
jgi:hypothetical protein